MSETPLFMVVDDDIIVHLYYEGALKELGANAEIVIAHDGQKALDIIASSSDKMPTVIFLDITMPGVNGYEFLEAFSAQYPEAETTIIMVTSSRLEEDKQRCKSYPCVKEFITKPPRTEDLERICRMHGAL